ncbi:MAG TPA: EpsD family peptidyl-prolyl cis-trans isomerase [Sphingomonadaceae bacterium]|nr:EpsD family peptidyl-prolyl cis-trans isomerase [Sphingomonadaceae bacterium]
MSTRLRMALLCAGVSVALASCGKKAPEGQVVASLNGQEITLQELNAELQGTNIPDSVDKKEAMRTLLQRVIDRKLIDSAAAEQGLDKSAEYLTQKRRADEALLAQLYAKQQASTLPVPTAADISKFMADHPNMFAQRERLTLNQIRFAKPKDDAVLKALEPTHSLDEVEKVLGEHNIKFDRGHSMLDTATVPQEILKQIAALPAGEPFVVPGPGVVMVSVVTGRTAVPVEEAQAKTIAVNAWREEQFEKAMSDKLKSLRETAKISYQPGFEPPADKGAKPAVPAIAPTGLGNAAAPAPAQP